MVQVFRDYLSALQRLGSEGTFRIEQPSVEGSNKINVSVQSGTFEGCQAIIQDVMNDCASATFTIPVKSADGSYVAVGHYTKSDDELPEL